MTGLKKKKKDQIKGLRIFTDEQMTAGGRVKVRYAMALYYVGIGLPFKLQLSAVTENNKKALVAGDLSTVDYLPADKYAEPQMALVAAIRRRLMAATAEEIDGFRKGQFIQLSADVR